MNIKEKAKRAKQVTSILSCMSQKEKSKFLKDIAKELVKNKSRLFKENEKDMDEEKNAVLKGRLKFNDAKINDLVLGLNNLADMDDPVGKITRATELDDGLELYRVSYPLGVVGVIFESRPDAMVQIASLCFKSGNCVLLKGGKEARNTLVALHSIFVEVSMKNNINPNWIQMLYDREDVARMLKLEEYVDMIIPRGSKELIRHIMDNTRIPVLGHSDGICHIYIDDDADLDMAIKICVDAKCQYPAACNAVETLLVNSKIASRFLPKLQKAMPNVKLLGDDKVRKIINVEKATEKDWRAEYNDLILSIRIVESLEHALEHINKYGSKHTDSIVTKDRKKAEYFMHVVDSANVYWNASTRFSDGFRYGFGAEVGIATSKIHARGPVGLDGLLTYKWKLVGTGNIVADYNGEKPKRKFKHRDIL